ncbi:VWA domain-containing protein [Shewanella sp. VB17]|uniref:vWA domain-containing protein n=1 Tax=Shewanella sp. VB17 TaxID=2739432 RepID=UPI00156324CF|nr:VWA domain-containing protein [Shewanella sp. VB17]NRD73431.1 VWA domain-containing protein [Shewanella sp. VB17]
MTKYLNRQRGDISLMFVICLPFMLSIIAVSILLAMYLLTVTRAGQAADAASLACGYAQRADQDLTVDFLNYYRPGFVAHDGEVLVSIDAKKRCSISASYRFNPVMMAFLPESVSSDVALSSASHSISHLVVNSRILPIDLALVLDISGSMSGQLPQLKRIITSAIEDIHQQDTDETGAVRFSLVPFQSGVGVINAPWMPESAGKITCVDGLSYGQHSVDYAATVDDLGKSAASLEIKTVSPSEWLDACSSDVTILPLTDDLKRVTKSVNALTTDGSTSSYQGLIWGVRTLLPQWQEEWQINPVESTDLVQRLILFTDGADQGTYLDDLIEQGLCRVIQSQFNIEMSFIGFDVDERRLQQFRECAGEMGKVYDAKNTQELAVFFQEALQTETKASLVLREESDN